MNMQEAVLARHSVRAYENKPIDEATVAALSECIEACNREGDLHIRLVLNEPKAFDCFRAHYGKFSNVTNYVALIGKKGKDLDEKIGFYGEKIALLAQTIGLNTCWVAMTYKKVKTAFSVEDGEKLRVVLALGYGKTQGVAHACKAMEKVSNVTETSPTWFVDGVRSALLAPTAMNQQKFFFALDEGGVTASAKTGFYAKIDLGIAKCHFEIGAGKENFSWKD